MMKPNKANKNKIENNKITEDSDQNSNSVDKVKVVELMTYSN